MPTNPSVETLRNRARQLRRQQSEAEKCLWAVLRARQFHGYKFRRQFVIGSVLADFCCLQHRIVIEIDGGQHADQLQPIKAVPLFYVRVAFVYCGFGTMRCYRI